MREPNVIMTLCRRWPLVICSASQSSDYTHAHTKLRATAAHMKGLDVMSVEESVLPAHPQFMDYGPAMPTSQTL